MALNQLPALTAKLPACSIMSDATVSETTSCSPAGTTPVDMSCPVTKKHSATKCCGGDAPSPRSGDRYGRLWKLGAAAASDAALSSAASSASAAAADAAVAAGDVAGDGAGDVAGCVSAADGCTGNTVAIAAGSPAAAVSGAAASGGVCRSPKPHSLFAKHIPI